MILSSTLLVFSGGRRATAQTTTVLFDEDDDIGSEYREASFGYTVGGDSLALLGPENNRMPVVTAYAFQGSTSGLVGYRHTKEGSWALSISADNSEPVDFGNADSLAFYLNAPIPIVGEWLPRFRLTDGEGQTTASLTIETGIPVGYNSSRSGYLPGSSTDGALRVEYIEALPDDQIRPGYPEDVLIIFSDEILDTSRAAIGVPSIPIKFMVETAHTGRRLEVSFKDDNGDSTLSARGESMNIYTPEDREASRSWPTWDVSLDNSHVPAPGDQYLVAVDNGGLDGDPATWRRIAVSMDDFGPLGAFDTSRVRSIRFENGSQSVPYHDLWVDAVAGLAYAGNQEGLPPPSFTAQPGDTSVVLRWNAIPEAAGYHVYRRSSADKPFQQLTNLPVTARNYADLRAHNGTGYTYILRSLGADGVEGPDSDPVTATPSAGMGDAFLDLLQELAFNYFWQEANPENGLVKDRSTPTSASSIAAVGFGLSAITIGIDKGWITRAQGRDRVLTTLEFFRNCPQDASMSAVCGYRGFFYHFLEMDTGYRAGTSELSTIDTALLLGGILHAAAYFDDAGVDEMRIRTLAEKIFERVEWDWASPRPPLVALSWKPGNDGGFSQYDWRGYNEAMILYILALGSPTHPLPPEAWTAWTSTYVLDNFYGNEYVVFPPLFGHQYSHVWIDFRGIQDAYMRGVEVDGELDYFKNSRRATLANRAYAIDNPRRYANYGPNEWGLTASDDPFGYRAHGAPPAQSDNGTITPTAAGGSYAFTPTLSVQALRNFYRKYRPRLWGQYGFRDAFNIHENWFATDVLGIDQGPILLMIENGRTGAIWDVMMTHPAVKRGLNRAGFETTSTDGNGPPSPPTLALEGAVPNPAGNMTRIHFSISHEGFTTLALYDVLGRKVATLIHERLNAGAHTVAFNACRLASGVYFYRL